MTIKGRKLGEPAKLLLLSLLVGLGSGLAAVALEKGIDAIQKSILPILNRNGHLGWGYLVFPAIGMFLAMLVVRYVVRDNISHGVTKVLLAVSRNESRIKSHNTWSSLLTSALTIGFGGSVGAEAPIVYTGAAIGSNIGKTFKLSYRGITTLLGCGAAGAIAGIFRAPLAGVLFTLEILLFNMSMSSMMPLLMSTVTATVVSYLLLGPQTPFSCSIAPFNIANMPFYLLLGVFCGLFSLYFTRTTLWMEDRIGHNRSRWLKWLYCSLALGLLIFIFPPLFGEGYGFVGSLLNGEAWDLEGVTPLASLLHSGWGVPLFVLLVLLFKVVSMTLTNAGGGVGGTFGPTLFVGALAGFVLVRSLNLLPAGLHLPEQNFVLVGMAGLMAGVMQAPMTAIFLIAEITGGYDLLLPLILCSATSFGTTRIREKYSIYTKRIAQSGDLLTHDNDQAVMTLLQVKDLVSDKYPHISMDSTLADILPTIVSSTVAVFPVLDDGNRFAGILEMDEIRKHILDPQKADTVPVSDLVHNAPGFVSVNEKMDSVMRKFDRTDAWRLPVLTDDGMYLGFISRSRILKAYREELKKISED
ncbi:MAG: chloride channel protein [Bacteroidales bacterium]|nr:chloride channel protein [Bacteroidales bacterium]